MNEILLEVRPKSRQYLDKTQFEDIEAQNAAKLKSSTLYVGNLSLFTLEEELYSLFSKCGLVKRIVMGLHRIDRKPCGFCFVIYHKRESAVLAEHLLNQMKFHDKFIKVEMDAGFREGRQYGRARGGGQVRDEIAIQRQQYRQQQNNFRGRNNNNNNNFRNNRFNNNRNYNNHRTKRFENIKFNRANDNNFKRKRGRDEDDDGDSKNEEENNNNNNNSKRVKSNNDEEDVVNDDELEERRRRRRRRRNRRAGDDSDDDSDDDSEDEE